MDEYIKSSYLKTFLYATVSFGIPMGLLFAATGAGVAAVGAGAIAGILFSAVITIFVVIQGSRIDKVRKRFIGNVPVVLKGGANHLISGEAAGGWLFLTNDSLYFKSHSLNFRNHEITIPLSEIQSVEKFTMLGFVPNGMKIITQNGQEAFVVNGRKRWMQEISLRIAHHSA